MKTCENNYLRFDDVQKYVGGLYHNASKHFHGHDKVIVDAQSWSANEVLSLSVIFEHFKIPCLFITSVMTFNWNVGVFIC